MPIEKNNFVRVRFGAVWLFGQIDDNCGDGWFNCYYGSKKQFQKGNIDTFAGFHESDIRLMTDEEKKISYLTS